VVSGCQLDIPLSSKGRAVTAVGQKERQKKKPRRPKCCPRRASRKRKYVELFLDLWGKSEIVQKGQKKIAGVVLGRCNY